MGSRAPAALQVQDPSGRELVNSMSILRDMDETLSGTQEGSIFSRYRCDVPVYALGDQVPEIDTDAFIHPDAVIIGSVFIGAGSSIWPGAVLRGDDGEIRIGERTSVQDGSVLHTTHVWPTVVGSDCVIGHIVHLEGCTIEDRALVGNGSIVMHRVIVRSGAVVGANSVLLNGTEVPSGALAVGSPAVIKEGRARAADIEMAAASYVERSRRYRSSLRRVD